MGFVLAVHRVLLRELTDSVDVGLRLGFVHNLTVGSMHLLESSGLRLRANPMVFVVEGLEEDGADNHKNTNEMRMRPRGVSGALGLKGFLVSTLLSRDLRRHSQKPPGPYGFCTSNIFLTLEHLTTPHVPWTTSATDPPSLQLAERELRMEFCACLILIVGSLIELREVLILNAEPSTPN